jgi:hypothetical protein
MVHNRRLLRPEWAPGPSEPVAGARQGPLVTEIQPNLLALSGRGVGGFGAAVSPSPTFAPATSTPVG